jgi:RNA polymerase sigma-70 factor (ECF subfamily)
LTSTRHKASEDDKLANKAARDVDAFEELYRLYFPRVYRFVRYRSEDQSVADDLTSNIFETVLAKLDKFDAKRGSFATWIFTIARNVIIDHYRRDGRSKEVDLWRYEEAVDTQTNLESHMQTEERLLALKAEFNRLAEREREILALKFAAGLSNREIANIMPVTETNVASILFRAIRKLRKGMLNHERTANS